MRCAVIDPVSGAVLNVIVADPSDPAPEGTQLIGLADDASIDTTCTWTPWGWVAPPYVEPPPKVLNDG